jgi:mannose-6-phosphate isomerase-like protein (cupin superfamily)
LIIRTRDLLEERQDENALVLRRIVRADQHGPNLSVSWARIAGRHRRIVNPDCDRAYYVIEGSARFQVGDGAPVEEAGAGDCVFVPRGTPYEFEGEMTYLVINGPAFTPGSDRVLPGRLRGEPNAEG